MLCPPVKSNKTTEITGFISMPFLAKTSPLTTSQIWPTNKETIAGLYPHNGKLIGHPRGVPDKDQIQNQI